MLDRLLKGLIITGAAATLLPEAPTFLRSDIQQPHQQAAHQQPQQGAQQQQHHQQQEHHQQQQTDIELQSRLSGQLGSKFTVCLALTWKQCTIFCDSKVFHYFHEKQAVYGMMVFHAVFPDKSNAQTHKKLTSIAVLSNQLGVCLAGLLCTAAVHIHALHQVAAVDKLVMRPPKQQLPFPLENHIISHVAAFLLLYLYGASSS